MRIYSTLDRHELERIAARMDCQLYEYDDIRQPSRGRFAGHAHAAKCLLRPLGDTFRLAREDDYCKAGVRRVWAVSWAGHYVFMRAIFERDPEAVIVTAMAEWRGLEDFENRAWGTAHRNIGSMMAPQSYRDAQAPDHAPWGGLEDLRDRARVLAAA